MSEQTKPIFARVPAELHTTLKITAVKEGVTVAELVERALRIYLAAV